VSPTTLRSPPAERPQEPPRAAGAGFLLPALALAALALFGLALWLYLSQRPPGDDSAEAGFARDMIVHHAQAVEMSGIVLDRTNDERIRTLANDIALTQQGQIGQMQGWLDVWGLPPTGSEPAMTWMGHPHEGLMPGMATAEELNEMRAAPPEEAEEMFLRLMIEHHEAAIPMTEAVLERSDTEAVTNLADAIASSQTSEVRVMQDLLADRSAPVEEDGPSGGHGDHSEHGH
jgi:uncharacterized protein (DUF305 family)